MSTIWSKCVVFFFCNILVQFWPIALGKSSLVPQGYEFPSDGFAISKSSLNLVLKSENCPVHARPSWVVSVVCLGFLNNRLSSLDLVYCPVRLNSLLKFPDTPLQSCFLWWHVMPQHWLEIWYEASYHDALHCGSGVLVIIYTSLLLSPNMTSGIIDSGFCSTTVLIHFIHILLLLFSF